MGPCQTVRSCVSMRSDVPWVLGPERGALPSDSRVPPSDAGASIACTLRHPRAIHARRPHTYSRDMGIVLPCDTAY